MIEIDPNVVIKLFAAWATWVTVSTHNLRKDVEHYVKRGNKGFRDSSLKGKWARIRYGWKNGKSK